jgi:hypothetical protein
MHGHMVDHQITQSYDVKSSEYTLKVVAYDDSEFFADRLWTHPNPDVLYGLCHAFLQMCDAVLFPGPPAEQKPITKEHLIQLDMFSNLNTN